MCFATAPKVGNNEQNHGGERGNGRRRITGISEARESGVKRKCHVTWLSGAQRLLAAAAPRDVARRRSSAAATDELKGLAALTAARCSVSGPDHRPSLRQPVRGLPWTGPRARLVGCCLQCRGGGAAFVRERSTPCLLRSAFLAPSARTRDFFFRASRGGLDSGVLLFFACLVPCCLLGPAGGVATDRRVDIVRARAQSETRGRNTDGAGRSACCGASTRGRCGAGGLRARYKFRRTDGDRCAMPSTMTDARTRRCLRKGS